MRNSLLVILLLCCLASCHSTKLAVREQVELPGITEGRLLKNVETNALDFNTLYAKKINLNLRDGEKSNNLKAILRVQRDSFIWMSITAPMGIEVARVLLTPDSVKMISPREKQYFLSDYTFFLDKFDVNLTFDCFQRILTNQFFDFTSCTSGMDKSKHYKLDRSGDDYLLYSLEEKAIGRKLKRLYKKKRRHKEYTLVMQKIHVHPSTFRPTRVAIEDLEDELEVSVRYADFETIGDRLFPMTLVFKLFSGDDDLELTLEFSRLEFDVKVSPSFRISPKYERIY